ncbi:MAG: hypothetical protein AB8B51_03375 [Sedimentitalea sp.]
MATVIILENDVARTLRGAVKPKGLQLNKPLLCKVTLNVDDKAYKVLDDDPLLLAKMTEASSAVYAKVMDKLGAELKKADAAYVKTNSVSERNKIISDFESSAKKLLGKLADVGAKAAQGKWDEFKKTKSEYMKYKVKAGVDLAIDGLNVAGGIAGAVGSGGFSLIISLYGIIKTLIGMAMKVYKLAIDADKMQKKVTKGLAKVQKSFDKKKKEVSGAKDTGKAFVNSLLGADFIPTVSSVKSDNDQYLSKLQGVDVNSHALAKKLNDVLKAVDDIAKKPDVQRSKKVQTALKKLQSSTAKLIDKVIMMQEKVNEGKTFQKNTSDAIKEIETFQPKKWKYIQKGFVLTDIVLAGGDYAKAGEAVLGVATAVVTEVDKEMLDRV